MYSAVEVDDLVCKVCGGFCAISIVLLANPFHLQTQEESLHHRVVPAIAFAAHAAQQAMPHQ